MRYQDARNFVVEFGEALVTDRHNGLRGLAVGRKDEGSITGGGEFCVTAFVERKLDKFVLREREIKLFYEDVFRPRAEARRLPARRGEANVVELGGPLRLLAFTGSDHASPPTVNTQKWFLAPRPGVSICNPTDDYPKYLDAGTLGFLVEDGSHRYLVSNNHVIARSNAARPREVIVQPGTIDLNGFDITALKTDGDVQKQFGIAELAHTVSVTLRTPGGSQTNFVDAAMAKIIDSNRLNEAHGRFGYSGKLTKFGADYQLDETTGEISGSPDVIKVGRSTGYTEGYVASLVGTIELDFGTGTAIFVDQIDVRPGKDNCGVFSADGDSGAALVNHNHEIVGMIFAGGPRCSFANPINLVIDELKRVSGATNLDLVP